MECSFGVHRQRQPEDSLTGTTGYVEIAAVRAGNIQSDAEAEPGAWDLTLDRRTPVHSLEDPALLVYRNPVTLICDRYPNRTILVVDTQDERCIRLRILQRVVQQLFDRQFYEAPIDHGRVSL